MRVKLENNCTIKGRTSWYRKVSGVDTSKTNISMSCFKGEFLPIEKEIDLEEGAIIIEKVPQGSFSPAVVYRVKNSTLVVEGEYHDIYENFFGVRPHVAELLKEKKDRKLLRLSIQKWEAILDGYGDDRGRDNCALCHEYGRLCGAYLTLGGCPVREKTGIRDCACSPYHDWRTHHWEIHGSKWPFAIQCERCEKLASEELEFLRGLLGELEDE